MLILTMTNDNDIASKFKVTIRILFVCSRIIVLVICFRPNSKDSLIGTALLLSKYPKLLVSDILVNSLKLTTYNKSRIIKKTDAQYR